MLYPFSFVGCWNKPMPGIPLAAQPRYRVAKAIMDTRESPDEVIILGGDNIYAVEGSKAHNEAEFNIGAGFYEEADVFTAIGNHNLGVFADTGHSKLTAHADVGWIPAAEETYYRVPFAEADIIVLDSNLRKGAQARWLHGQIQELKATGKPWWLVQHEPFASFKKKKEGKMKEHAIANNYSRNVFYMIKQHPPIAVLCADTHNYQRGRLVFPDGLEITQYVVGTGGGIPDRITKDDIAAVPPIDTGLVQYVVDEVAEGFGFLRVEGPVAIAFVTVMPWMAGGAQPKNLRQTQKRCRARRSQLTRGRHSKKHLRRRK
jgi:hypothetical protein